MMTSKEIAEILGKAQVLTGTWRVKGGFTFLNDGRQLSLDSQNGLKITDLYGNTVTQLPFFGPSTFNHILQSRDIVVAKEVSFSLSNQAYPSIIIYGATAKATDYLKLQYLDIGGGFIGTGSGNLNFSCGGTVALTSAASSTAITHTTPQTDLGDDNPGTGIIISNNNNSTNPGAGYLCLKGKDGTAWFLWVDATGDLRIHTSAPNTTNDTAGTVVGSQA